MNIVHCNTNQNVAKHQVVERKLIGLYILMDLEIQTKSSVISFIILKFIFKSSVINFMILKSSVIQLQGFV